ncbi:uncharacterized protein LOC126969704 [Leptidea sinapis]|uniref:uncharacterized protein LOC126969704 n=1 Tax=Leptidea sinapis TaxID=189913 RepID=UPI0021C3A3D2|nr:uncharacterized protein LOC126969704 [Leptidea sinapis]
MDKKIKLNITQMIQNSTKIEKLLTNSKKCATDKRTRGFLDSRMEILQDYWSSYSKSFETLSVSIDAETLQTDYNLVLEENFERTEEYYLELMTWLKDKLYELKEEKYEGLNSETSLEVSKMRPKLPPISIPQFSGDYSQWMSFRDLFRSLIHNDDRLTKIEKHHYLKSSLSGEAEQLLKNYSLTEANYDDAWKKLNERYENKRMIVNNILSRFLSQKALTTESAKGIKDLLDTSSQCLTSLTNLKVDSWNSIVVHILVSKLDIESHKLWEQSLENSTSIPTYEDLISFLEKRFRTMEMVNISQPPQRHTPKTVQQSPRATTAKSFATEVENTCTFCSQNHYICHCKGFASLPVPERQDFVKKNNICFNCLVKGHSVFNCRQSTVCKKCGRRHHTLIHFTSPKDDNAGDTAKERDSPKGNGTAGPKTSCNVSVNLKAETNDDLVILATAVVYVDSKNSGTYALRALVDQGSQGSFISEGAAQLLKLNRIPVNGKISGISNSSVVTTKSMVSLTVHSTKDNASTFKVNAYVLRKLTSLLPSREFPQDTWPLSMQLDLADPNFHKPGSIDILLGADVHAYILLEGLHKSNSLIALNSRLGWLISGRVSQTDSVAYEHNMVVMQTKVETDQLLRRFWEIEENLPHKKPMTDLEIQCEEHFKNTHTRNDVGRYIVRLPFKEDPPTNLGDAKPLAISRLQQMEKRFTRKPEFKEKYHTFLKQYESQGHMMMVPEKETETQKVYYLPHHAVLRSTSLSTKLRVVFDGSAAPEKGKSLNDELLIGCSLQQDIRDLITRWRQHKICLVADIRQMYRRILVNNDDVDYQRIVWRESPTQPIKEYRLLTVTYGTSCAPFLAIRTLHQLAEDEKNDFPTEAEILKNDVYMDDLMTGASTVGDVVKLQKGLTELMADSLYISVPRWFGVSDDTTKRELHGFSDASCTAYAAVVYLRVLGNEGEVKVYLVIAKSKVAPAKQISVPRLELCGAVLLAKLIQHVKTILNIPDDDVFTWTDSTIVLAWLRKTPNTWTTFVANRTSEILTLTNSNQWHHVCSANNPADLASRGTFPNDLQQSNLWWSGPQFLHDTDGFELSPVDIPSTDLEMKATTKILCNVNFIEKDDAISYLKRFSTLSKLIRVTAYCCRYFNLLKVKITKNPFTKAIYLSADELDDALNRCIKLSQSISFRDEISLLSSEKQVPKSSKIYVLHPFIDDDGIVRVGGRLANAEISKDMKNPIILSGASRELDLAFKDSQSLTVTEVSELLANDRTQWKFIPPRAPHFGGQTFLTYEELTTLLSQVEACVNSRPLTLMNSTLDEPPLTPGHFLIREPLIGVPEPSLLDVKLSPLNRWHIIQRMVQSLWSRWRNEYLTTLQHRYKWNTNQTDLPIGTVVLVKDDMLPPGKWLLGRIIQKHPGTDGITRVVTLKYKDSVFKRPIAKLCPLPLDEPDSL